MVKNLIPGSGMGTGKPRNKSGGFEECICPKCKKKVQHTRGMPCSKVKCPECGSPMTGTGN